MAAQFWALLKRRDALVILFVAAIACLVLFGELANEVAESETAVFDSWMHDLFRDSGWRALNDFMHAVTLMGGPIWISVVLIGGVALLWRSGRRWQAGTLLLDAVGGFAVIGLAKLALHRARPELWQAHMGSSFPSGHTFDAVTIYGLLGYWLALAAPTYRRTIIGSALGLIVLIGSSRVIVGVHYPADIVGGLLLGVPWLFVCVAFQRVGEERASKPPVSMEPLEIVGAVPLRGSATGENLCRREVAKTLTTYKQPGWWSNEDDSAWDRVKLAFKNDWEQTKHDFGSDTARDLDQNVDDTVKQMAGKEDPRQPAIGNDFDAIEPAYRYGFAAKRHFGDTPANELDRRFRDDWTAMGRDDYDAYRDEIRRGYDYSGT